MAFLFRLRKHADYQRVYQSSRKQFSRQMSYFVARRPPESPDITASPRVGLTVGKVMGKAVDRNRIKRRMREAVRRNIDTLEGLSMWFCTLARASLIWISPRSIWRWRRSSRRFERQPRN